MSKETILKIRETEENAARTVAEAEARAKEMRAEAEKAGMELCSAAEAEALAERAERTAQTELAIADMQAQVLAETEETLKEVANKARLSRTSAQKIVIRGLDTKCR